MRGDLSRATFNRKKHYKRVLKQQGRVELDADANESIKIHRNARARQGRRGGVVDTTFARVGMVGGAEVDKQCALVADIGLQQAQLLAGKPILGVAVYEEEGKDERELAWLMDRRTRGHAGDAYQMLYRPGGA